MSFLLNLIPPQYRLIIEAVIVAGIFAAGAYSGWQIESLRWGASETAAVTAAIDATNKANAEALGALRAEMQRANSAALADQAQQLAIGKSVAKQKVIFANAPLDPEACRPATARDVAVLRGVFDIIAAADPGQGGARPAAPGAAGGNPTPGSASNDHDARPTRPSDAGPSGMGGSPMGAILPSPDLGQRLRAVIGR